MNACHAGTPAYSGEPSARSIGRSNGWLRSSEKIAAPRCAASSRNAFARSHPAPGTSTLSRPPSPWITIGNRLRTPSSINSCSSEASSPPTTLFGRYEMLPPPACPASSTSRVNSPSDAKRLGTGFASPSTWVGECDDEKPAAPAAIASRSARRIAPISSAVASRRVASSPITERRSAEWPT